MIEFKAACGHTVRARDEDAGGEVRCSYCGRSSNVPDDHGDDLDFLFNDIQETDKTAAPASRKRRARRGGMFGGSRTRTGEFDPFAVIVRMCYAAGAIIVVIFVGRVCVPPVVDWGTEVWSHWFPGGAGRTAGPISNVVTQPEPADPESAPLRLGLNPRPAPGLYAVSTPHGATFYCMPAEDAPRKGRIYRSPRCRRIAGGESTARVDGTYVVEAALPVSDEQLMRYPGYPRVRRAIEAGTQEERTRWVNEYFLPDGATVFVDESEGQRYIVRQYRPVELYDERSRGVRALFLPRLTSGNKHTFSIEQLLLQNYVPPQETYGYDESHVKRELGYHLIPPAEQVLVLETLSRIGVIPCRCPDGKTRLFAIDIYDGRLITPVVSDPAL